MCPQTHAHVKKTAHENCEKPAILKAIMRFATETRLARAELGAEARARRLLAPRVISLRYGIWSLPEHSGHWSSRTPKCKSGSDLATPSVPGYRNFPMTGVPIYVLVGAPFTLQQGPRWRVRLQAGFSL